MPDPANVCYYVCQALIVQPCKELGGPFVIFRLDGRDDSVGQRTLFDLRSHRKERFEVLCVDSSASNQNHPPPRRDGQMGTVRAVLSAARETATGTVLIRENAAGGGEPAFHNLGLGDHHRGISDIASKRPKHGSCGLIRLKKSFAAKPGCADTRRTATERDELRNGCGDRYPTEYKDPVNTPTLSTSVAGRHDTSTARRGWSAAAAPAEPTGPSGKPQLVERLVVNECDVGTIVRVVVQERQVVRRITSPPPVFTFQPTIRKRRVTAITSPFGPCSVWGRRPDQPVFRRPLATTGERRRVQRTARHC